MVNSSYKGGGSHNFLGAIHGHFGITSALISGYERNRTRPNFEMIIRLAIALGVTADELLGIKAVKDKNFTPSLKLQKRIKQIEKLTAEQKKTLLKTIDTFIKAAQI